MITNFSVENFRCFKKLEISDLRRINLFAGKNNVGKTALLEAIFLFSGSFNPEIIIRIEVIRGLESLKIEFIKTESPWSSIFHNFNTEDEILLKAQTKSKETKVLITTKIDNKDYQTIVNYIIPPGEKTYKTSLEKYPIIKISTLEDEESRITYMVVPPSGPQIIPFPPPPPSFLCTYLSTRIRTPYRQDADRFSELAKVKKQEVVLEALKIIEPRLKDIAILTINGESVLHGDIGTGIYIPLPLMGEGMSKIASLILSIASTKNGVVLIDELENGIHYSVLTDIWSAIAEAAKRFNCQIFATTHSFECIRAAHECFSKSEEYDFCFYRLERIEENIVAKRYDKETLEASLDIGIEIR